MFSADWFFAVVIFLSIMGLVWLRNFAKGDSDGDDDSEMGSQQ